MSGKPAQTIFSNDQRGSNVNIFQLCKNREEHASKLADTACKFCCITTSAVRCVAAQRLCNHNKIQQQIRLLTVHSSLCCSHAPLHGPAFWRQDAHGERGHIANGIGWGGGVQKVQEQKPGWKGCEGKERTKSSHFQLSPGRLVAFLQQSAIDNHPFNVTQQPNSSTPPLSLLSIHL